MGFLVYTLTHRCYVPMRNITDLSHFQKWDDSTLWCFTLCECIADLWSCVSLQSSCPQRVIVYRSQALNMLLIHLLRFHTPLKINMHYSLWQCKPLWVMWWIHNLSRLCCHFCSSFQQDKAIHSSRQITYL